jgi:hypothetical protein
MVWQDSFGTSADAAVTGAVRRSSGAALGDAQRIAKGVEMAGDFMASDVGGNAGWNQRQKLISHNSTRWYRNARRAGERP